MRTAVVILNWNTKQQLQQFLPGVKASLSDDCKLIVADNASSDGSVEMLKKHFPDVVNLCFNKNYGFTGGYNLAFEETIKLFQQEGTHLEYFLLLNSDIEVSGDWLTPLVKHMDSHPHCGACAPKLHSYYKRNKFEYAGAAGGYIDKYGYPFCRGRVLKKVCEDKGQYDYTNNDVFWASGACLLVRAELFRKLGGLDERFFAHMEEIDLCWRMQLEGYKINVIPQSTVWHVGGASLSNNSPYKLKLNFRNNLLMLENNLAKTYALDFFKKGNSYKKAASKAHYKAIKTIFIRKILDFFSAVFYLMSFKFSYFKAVFVAHLEYYSMKGKVTNKNDLIAFLKNLESRQNNNFSVKGRYDRWIIFDYIFRKDKIFKIE